jgi:hypothetical protein
MRSRGPFSKFLLHREISLFALLIFAVSSPAQDVKVNGGFLSDSLQIGEQTAFYLAAHYPSDLNLLFPDSTADLSPFEFQKLVYFPTQTANGISLDSAVYYLTTFEVDRLQSISLPVYVVQPQDCTVFNSPRDSIQITQLVAEVPDSVSVDKLPLKMNAAYHTVDYQFNFWIALILFGVVVIIAALAWIFFGKRIRVWLTTRRLRKRHLKFVQTYNESVRQLQTSFSSMTTEAALSSWKKYMEQLEARPYTKLTTRETLHALKDDVLAKNLKAVDSAIYGHNTSVLESLEALRGFADQRFSKKLEELRHG